MRIDGPPTRVCGSSAIGPSMAAKGAEPLAGEAVSASSRPYGPNTSFIWRLYADAGHTVAAPDRGANATGRRANRPRAPQWHAMCTRPRAAKCGQPPATRQGKSENDNERNEMGGF